MGNSNSQSTPFLKTLSKQFLSRLLSSAGRRAFCCQDCSRASFLLGFVFCSKSMCFDQELVHIAGDNSATRLGHVLFQLDTEPEAMTLILIPGTVPYVTDNSFSKKKTQHPQPNCVCLGKNSVPSSGRVIQDITSIIII